MEGRLMPTILTLGRYVLFFWMNEPNEPVHIHIAIRKPTEHATKFWLTADGGCILASNGSNLPKKELRKLARFITFNHGRICDAWKHTFQTDTLRFYR